MPPYRILSLSGGGIRGLIICKILVRLEQLLAENTGNKDARVADYFDMVCGVSTGGIITLLSLIPGTMTSHGSQHPKYSAQQILDIYLAEYKNIFKASWSLWGAKYVTSGIEAIGNKYGGIMTLSQLCKNSLLISYDLDKRKPHFFTPKQDFYIKDVMRATCAAPTYFAPAEITSLDGQIYHLIDGGTVANNPSICGLSSVLKNVINHNSKNLKEDIFLLNISCGQNRDVYAYSKVQYWGKLEWIEPLINILIDGNMECVNTELHHMLGDNYVQLDPPLVKASEALDDCSEKNVEMLQKDTNDYLNSKEIQLLLNKIIIKILRN